MCATFSLVRTLFKKNREQYLNKAQIVLREYISGLAWYGNRLVYYMDTMLRKQTTLLLPLFEGEGGGGSKQPTTSCTLFSVNLSKNWQFYIFFALIAYNQPQDLKTKCLWISYAYYRVRSLFLVYAISILMC